MSDKYFIELILYCKLLFPLEVAQIVTTFINQLPKPFISLDVICRDIKVKNENHIFQDVETLATFLKSEQKFSEQEIAHFIFHGRIALSNVFYRYTWETMNHYHRDFLLQVCDKTWLEDAVGDKELFLFNDRMSLNDMSVVMKLVIKKNGKDVVPKFGRFFEELMTELFYFYNIEHTDNTTGSCMSNDIWAIGYDITWQENLRIIKEMQKIVGKTVLLTINKHEYFIAIKRIL